MVVVIDSIYVTLTKSKMYGYHIMYDVLGASCMMLLFTGVAVNAHYHTGLLGMLMLIRALFAAFREGLFASFADFWVQHLFLVSIVFMFMLPVLFLSAFCIDSARYFCERIAPGLYNSDTFQYWAALIRTAFCCLPRCACVCVRGVFILVYGWLLCRYLFRGLSVSGWFLMRDVLRRWDATTSGYTGVRPALWNIGALDHSSTCIVLYCIRT